MLPANELPFLGVYNDKKVMLLELPHSHIPPGTDKIIAWLLKRNVLPMIAHPERNKDILRKFEKVEPLIELGCLFQLTAGSVCGQFGEAAQERAEQLLERGVVTVLATDAHHVERRPANLKAGRDAAALIVGREAAGAMVYSTPLSIAAAQFSVA